MTYVATLKLHYSHRRLTIGYCRCVQYFCTQNAQPVFLTTFSYNVGTLHMAFDAHSTDIQRSRNTSLSISTAHVLQTALVIFSSFKEKLEPETAKRRLTCDCFCVPNLNIFTSFWLFQTSCFYYRGLHLWNLFRCEIAICETICSQALLLMKTKFGYLHWLGE